MQNPPRLRVHAALLLVAVLFSVNYIVSKFSMRALAPLSFAWLRIMAASILLLPFLPSSWKALTARDLRQLAGLAVLGVVINQTFFLTGLALSSAHVAAILVTSTPVFALAAAIALRREPVRPLKVAGITLAAAGALLIVGGHSFSGAPRELLGSSLLFVNCLCYALYLVLSRPAVQRLGARVVVTGAFVIGALLMFPISLPSLLRENWASVPPSAWGGLAFVILGPTIVAYMLNAWALHHAESSTVAVYTYVQPFLTAILAYLFLGELITLTTALAGALIIAGVFLATREGAPRPVEV